MRYLLYLFLMSTICHLSAQKELDYTLYLIGDTGEPILGAEDPVLNYLKLQLDQESDESAIIYLGDNVYPNGLPPKDQVQLRKEAETKLIRQLDILKNYKGEVYFLPGNHDWNEGKPGGRKYIREEEKFIEDYLKRGDVLIPDDGCPGPELKKLDNDVMLLVHHALIN